MAERTYVRQLDDGLWQWRKADSQGQWLSEVFYTGDINLLAESIDNQAVVLILSGKQAVSRFLEIETKDRKLLAKLAPFELEEDIVDPVEDLIFVYGPYIDNGVSATYVEREMAQDLIELLEEHGADVQACSVDYLEIESEHEPGCWTLLLDGDDLLVSMGAYAGFTIERELAPIYLKSLFRDALPAALKLRSPDQDSLDELHQLLPEDVKDNEDIHIEGDTGGFWDGIRVKVKPLLDFRTGPLARKLPFAQWFRAWQVPAIAVAAAFVVALSVSWLQIQTAKKERRAIIAERNELFREVIPAGAISDPIRQLKSKLGGAAVSEASNFMGMMEKVSGPIASAKSLNVSLFRYNHDRGQLQLNVEASDFAVFESLRTKIVDTGLNVEIKSANKSGDTHQAQLHVSEANI